MESDKALKRKKDHKPTTKLEEHDKNPFSPA